MLFLGNYFWDLSFSCDAIFSGDFDFQLILHFNAGS